MAIAWKIGPAIKPLSGHLARPFSPGNSVLDSDRKRQFFSGCDADAAGRAQPFIFANLNGLRHDGRRAKSPPRAARSPEVAEARPRDRPPVRRERVGPARGWRGRQAPSIHVRRVSRLAVDE